MPFTAPGDRVLAEVPEGSGPAHGVLLEVLEEGPERKSVPCPHFGPAEGARCGGCEWLHLVYPAQLAAKERALVETLRRVGRLESGRYQLAPILPSPSPLRYRARAKFHHDREAGRLVFFERRSHRKVAVMSCLLLEPGLDALREAVGPALTAVRLFPREVTLEWSAHEGRGAAHLLLPSVSGAAGDRAAELLAALPSLRGVVLSAEGAGSLVRGDPVLLQARRPGEAGTGLQRSRPDVFLQANRAGNALLVEAALGLLRPEGEEVLELYCGAGNFTLPLSARAKGVHAVEEQGPALELARADAGGRAVRFYAGDALAIARALAREGGTPWPRFGAALLDPPRQGARGLGPVLRDLGVPRAVYVSCDPATLARDLRACAEVGYRVRVVQAVDMFPETHHLEAVALLERRL